MLILVEGKWGVVEGAPRPLRQHLSASLATETAIVGDRLKFIPTKDALEELRKLPDVTFDPGCRAAWGHFYRKATARNADDFAFKTTPFKHQLEAWQEIKDLPYYALFWEMGLGKTKTALDVAAWKYSVGSIDGLLVMTMKGVHRNWVVKEIPEHLAVDEYSASFWNTNRVECGMRDIFKTKGLAVATINFDSVHQKRGEAFCRRFLTERRTLLVVDESQAIKTPSAQRTKAVRRLGKMAKSRLIMTGTPVTNSPLDLWAQFDFLSPSILAAPSFVLFSKRYAVKEELPDVFDSQGRPVKVVVGYKNLDDLKARIAPYSSRKTKDEVLDLPPKTYRSRPFELPATFRQAYSKMKEDLVIELDQERRVTAQLALTKLLRLQQLTCGFVVPDGSASVGEPFAKTNPRLQALMEVVAAIHGKAIIWANFRYSLIEIVAAIKKEYGNGSVVGYSGMTPDDARQRAVDLFQDPDSGVRFFVSQPQAGGTGITLTQARDVIYYTNGFNLGLRLQSEDRAHRIGQTGTVTYTDLEAVATIDRRIIRALREKRSLAAEITGDSLKAWLAADE